MLCSGVGSSVAVLVMQDLAHLVQEIVATSLLQQCQLLVGVVQPPHHVAARGLGNGGSARHLVTL